jgi:hypothetical protein
MISSTGRQDSRAVCITIVSVASLRLSVEFPPLKEAVEELRFQRLRSSVRLQPKYKVSGKQRASSVRSRSIPTATAIRACRHSERSEE